MKIKGYVLDDFKVQVYVDGEKLGHRASCKVVNHSPTGFQWGYSGSGPAQLALAILLLRTDNNSAQVLHQEFKKEYIATLEKDKDFEMDIDLEGWISQRDFEVIERKLGLNEAEPGSYSFPERCQRAQCDQCDCACGGENHKIQTSLFS